MSAPAPEAAAANAMAGNDVPPETAMGSRGGGGRGPARRLLRLLLGIALQIGLLVLVLLGLVLGTQMGLRTALAVAQELAPGLIRVGQVEGRLLGRLRLQHLELHLPALDLRLGHLELNWTPLAALTGTLPIQRLQVRDLDLTLAPSEAEAPEPLTLPRVALPLALVVDELRAERVRVFRQGAAAPIVALEQAAVGARLSGSELALERLVADLSQPRLTARASGQAGLRDRYPLGLDLGWELVLPAAARLAGAGRVSGDLGNLTLTQELSGSVRLRLNAQLSELLVAPSWTGRIELDGLDLPAFVANAPPVALTGRIETRGDLDAATVTGTLDGRAEGPGDVGHLQAELHLLWRDRTLSVRALDLRESVSGALLSLAGSLDLRQPPGMFEVKGSWERLRWPLSGDLLAESPRGDLAISGTFDDYAYTLSALAQGPDLPPFDLALSGTGDGRGTHVGPLGVKTLEGTLRATGDLIWAPDLRWDLRIEGEGLNPAGIAPGIEDRLGLALTTQGTLDGFRYDLAATSQGPGLPPGRFALKGQGNRSRSEIESLRLEALEGQVEGEGRASWDPLLGWEAKVGWSGINPGSFLADWPGRLEGRIESQGTLEAEGPRLSALIEGVAGELRGFPVAAGGRLELAERSLRVQALEASSGPSRLRANGTLGEAALDLAFELGSPDLGTLLPQAKGRLQAKGRVGGTPTAPQIKLDLAAETVDLGGQGIRRIDGAIDVVLAPDGPFDVRLDGAGLVAGGLRFDQLQVRGDGAMPEHRLTLSVTGEPLSARVEATGSLAADRSYQGNLNRLDLDSAPWGNWRLQRPMPLKLAEARIGAGPLCLRNASGSGGCLGFDQVEAGRWSLDLDLEPLGVELIQGLLPGNLVAEGAGRVKGRFEAAGPVLSGSATVELPQGRLRITQGRGAGEVLDLSGTRLTLDSGARGIGSRFELPLRGLGSLTGGLELPGWRLDQAAWPDQPLRGSLRAQVEGLARVSNLVPDLVGVRGGIQADLTLGGTLVSPRLQGQASARGLGAEVPLIGLKLNDLNLNLLAAGDRLDLQGQGDLGGGRLELVGDARLALGGVLGRARVAGERLRVADTKEYFAVVSPSFDLELDPQGLRVRGEVKVPEARIRPRSLPAGTVSVSPDVVMVDQAGAPQGGGLPLDLDLRLRLGDDVSIDAFGIRGRLSGDLRVFQEPGRQLLGDGQLAIVDGLYRLSGGFGLAAEIGVPLTIEQGRLVFAKSPVDNPGLLLEAQREGGDTTAGVRVLGTLRDPKLAFFSESDPDMTQADITKYLLTGVPPRRDAGTEDRALSLGTYVRPKLYMEYETGLGDQKDKVKLRYDLTRRIELQTETGEGQGGDIFFKFER